MHSRLLVMFFIMLLFCFLGVSGIYAADSNSDLISEVGYRGTEFDGNNTGFDLGLGYRTDGLNWNIAGDLSGRNPDVLSELTWKDLQITELTAGFKGDPNERIFWQASLGYGRIGSGKVQDSDYNGDNRTSEFSRSNNRSSGANVMDLSIAGGYKLATAPDFQIAFLLGYSKHQQNLRITDGYQTLSSPGTPSIGAIQGLDSSYQAFWDGPWVGMKVKKQLQSRFGISGNFEYHWADYYAEGNWNLRDDLEHPVSFSHRADGTGTALAMGLSYTAGKQWFIDLSLKYSYWTTNHGLDQTFISDGNSTFTSLNRVNWQSTAYTLAVSHLF